MWLYHHDGKSFARDLREGRKVIISTGFALVVKAHIGTNQERKRINFFESNNSCLCYKASFSPKSRTGFG